MSSALLLAFGFGSPLMLWGLAIGGAPILIHLLHRRRYIEMPWAAMRFLIAATKKQSRRLRVEQILLLIVRTLIVLLVATALARPSVETFGEYFRAEGPRHRIIVIDATFSMGYRSQDKSRFDRARELARQIAGTARQGDAMQLVRIGESMPRVIALARLTGPLNTLTIRPAPSRVMNEQAFGFTVKHCWTIAAGVIWMIASLIEMS